MILARKWQLFHAIYVNINQNGGRIWRNTNSICLNVSDILVTSVSFRQRVIHVSNCTKRLTILVLNIPAHCVTIRQDGHPTYAGIKKPSMPLLILRRRPLFKELFPLKETFGSSKINCTVCIQAFDVLLWIKFEKISASKGLAWALWIWFWNRQNAFFESIIQFDWPGCWQ